MSNRCKADIECKPMRGDVIESSGSFGILAVLSRGTIAGRCNMHRWNNSG
jgi:hypothetical protein